MQILWRKSFEEGYETCRPFPLTVLRSNYSYSTCLLKLECINEELNALDSFLESEFYRLGINDDLELIYLYINPVDNKVLSNTYYLPSRSIIDYGCEESFTVTQKPIFTLLLKI